MPIAHEFQERWVERAAFRLSPIKTTVDETGRDWHDYRQILFLNLWRAQQDFQKIPKAKLTALSFKKWSEVAVRKMYMTCLRERYRAPSRLLRSGAVNYLRETAWVDDGLEKTVQNRDLLKKVRDCIDCGEWDLLMVYLANDCSASGAWKATGSCLTRRGFLKKINRICKKARDMVLSIDSTAT